MWVVVRPIVANEGLVHMRDSETCRLVGCSDAIARAGDAPTTRPGRSVEHEAAPMRPRSAPRRARVISALT